MSRARRVHVRGIAPGRRNACPSLCSCARRGPARRSVAPMVTMHPMTRSHPTIPAMMSSLMPFCAETITPPGARWGLHERRHPCRVVRLHRDEDHVVPVGRRRQLADVQRFGLRRERALHRRHRQAVRLDLVDVGRATRRRRSRRAPPWKDTPPASRAIAPAPMNMIRLVICFFRTPRLWLCRFIVMRLYSRLTGLSGFRPSPE